MYRVNFLDLLQAAVSKDRFRTGLDLIGVFDGSNVTFTVPAGDNFVHTPPFFSIQVYFNGIRLHNPDDYTVVESGGFGTGYDTVVVATAPRPGDHLLVDYIATGAP